MNAQANIKPLAYTFDEHSVRALLETDRLYFGLGATRSSDSGLDLLYMEGHVDSPSGAVIWGVDRRCGEDRFCEMLSRAENELRSLGGRVMRVYIEDPVPQALSGSFRRLLYRPRTELALMSRLPLVQSSGELDTAYILSRVKTEQEWRTKESLHAGEEGQPDGYRLLAADWVKLEREKCETGGMSCYLVFRGNEPVATVGLVRDRGIARLKNLYVSSQYRKRGVGLATIYLLAQEAGALGYESFGCFAVKGGNALRVYERTGLRVVSSVTEFSKDLV